MFRFVQLPIKFSYIFCSFRLKHVRQQQHIFYLFRVYLFRFCWSSCWFMLLGLYVAASFQRHSHMVRFAHEFPKCLFCSFFDTFFSGSRSSFYFLLVSCSFRLLPEHTHTPDAICAIYIHFCVRQWYSPNIYGKIIICHSPQGDFFRVLQACQSAWRPCSQESVGKQEWKRKGTEK